MIFFFSQKFQNRQNRDNNRAMPNKDIRICISSNMCLDDFSIPFNDILLFHEEMDAAAQIGCISMHLLHLDNYITYIVHFSIKLGILLKNKNIIIDQKSMFWNWSGKNDARTIVIIILKWRHSICSMKSIH